MLHSALRGGRRRAEQRRLERERQEAEAAALAKREAAIVAETARRKAQAEARERYARESREREISNLRFQVTQQKAWQRNVDHAARNAVAVQQRQALIAELDSMINPPPLPKPEPEQITYEQSDGSPHFGPDYNPKLAGQAVLRWR